MLSSILLFGGTFDPPHYGHLKTALAVQNQCHFDQFIFLPCKIPLLKHAASASAHDRLQMLTLMLKNYPEFSISTTELVRPTPSYMTETLQSFRKQVGTAVSITLLLGIDAFLKCPKWHDAETLPTLCHLLVMSRSGQIGAIENHPFANLFNPCNHSMDLLKTPNGMIATIDAGNHPQSSTELRKKVRAHENTEDDLPHSVDAYIQQNSLYTRIRSF